jgi:ABC-type multidrug transport system ATPase subunit
MNGVLTAQELVSDVSLLFLDEPTSGLDSFAASLLVDNVSRIVKERNLACFMTVHQPSWAIFCKLDRVILLARGSVYYDGPPRDTIPYFSQRGFDVPEGSNPADYFIGIAENKERDAEGEKRVNSLIERWAEHVRSRGIEDRSEASLRTLHGDAQGQGADGDKARRTMKSKEKHLWPTPWWEEFGLLFVRWFREAVSCRLLYADRIR